MLKINSYNQTIKRILVAGTLMAGALTANTATLDKGRNTKTDYPQYTEISSSTSSAIKAMTTPIVAEVSDTGSIRNKSLDERVEKSNQEYSPEFAEMVKPLIDGTYENLGLYGASIVLQANISNSSLGHSIHSFILNNISTFSQKEQSQVLDYTKIIGPTGELGKSTYNIFSNIVGDHSVENYKKITAQKANALLDLNANLLFEEINKASLDIYYKQVKEFNDAQNGSKTPEQKANLLSFKVFCIDFLLARDFCSAIYGNDFLSKLEPAFAEYVTNYMPSPIIDNSNLKSI